jgi:RND family efflux transporter MFP subunit
VDLPGTLRPWESIDLFARVAGYAREVRVDRGSRVAAGDVLLVLDAPELPADVRVARAKLGECEAEIAQKQSESELARVTHQRLAAVRKESPEGVSVHALDEAKAKAEVARRALDVARARARSVQAALERSQVMQDLCVIKAPFAGIVTDRWVDPGSFIPSPGSSRSEGARLLHLAGVSRLRLEIAVPETESRRVQVGTPARVTLDAVPGRSLEAAVSRVAGVLSPMSRTLAAEIDLDNPRGDIPAGAFARVRLVVEVRRDARVVPREAVSAVGGRPHLALIEAGRIARKPVTTGLSAGGVVEIVGIQKDGGAVEPPPDGALVGLAIPPSVEDGTEVTTEPVKPGGGQAASADAAVPRGKAAP